MNIDNLNRLIELFESLTDEKVDLDHWREAWDIAVRAKERLARCPLPYINDMKDQIIDSVPAKGFWSVWMTVFSDDADMLDRLKVAFP